MRTCRSPDSIAWRWERTADGGASWTPMMMIEYHRVPPHRPVSRLALPPLSASDPE